MAGGVVAGGVVADGLTAVAYELYAVAPSDFVAERNARAARAKAEKDPLAAQIKALRKPVLAAWLVNLLVRQMPDRVNDLVSLGQQLREANEIGNFDRVRELSRPRRWLADEMTDEVVALAAELGQPVSAAANDRLHATLNAAMTDARVEAALRTGLLVAPVVVTDFGEIDVRGMLALPEASGDAAPEPADPHAPADLSARRSSARAKAAKEVAEAKAEVAFTQATVVGTGRHARGHKERVQQLQAQVLRLRAELDEMQRSVSRLEATLEPLVTELTQAQEWCADSEATFLAAQAAAEKAVQRLRKAQAATR